MFFPRRSIVQRGILLWWTFFVVINARWRPIVELKDLVVMEGASNVVHIEYEDGKTSLSDAVIRPAVAWARF